MSLEFIKEARYQFSHIYTSGKWSNSWVLQRHPRSLRGSWRFLRGVLVVFDIMDVPRIHKGSYVSIFTSLHSWEVVYLTAGFCRASSKESKRTLEVPERSLGGF
jgi:hypothetical protein